MPQLKRKLASWNRQPNDQVEHISCGSHVEHIAAYGKMGNFYLGFLCSRALQFFEI